MLDLYLHNTNKTLTRQNKTIENFILLWSNKPNESMLPRSSNWHIKLSKSHNYFERLDNAFVWPNIQICLYGYPIQDYFEYFYDLVIILLILNNFKDEIVIFEKKKIEIICSVSAVEAMFGICIIFSESFGICFSSLYISVITNQKATQLPILQSRLAIINLQSKIIKCK